MTGGIGEHSAEVRALICNRLGFLGFTIDADRNQADGPVISSNDCRCTVHVVATDEERMMARRVVEVFDRQRSSC